MSQDNIRIAVSGNVKHTRPDCLTKQHFQAQLKQNLTFMSQPNKISLSCPSQPKSHFHVPAKQNLTFMSQPNKISLSCPSQTKSHFHVPANQNLTFMSQPNKISLSCPSQTKSHFQGSISEFHKIKHTQKSELLETKLE